MLMNMLSKGKYLIGWFSTGRNEAARDLFRAVWRSIKEGEIYLHIQQLEPPGEMAESDAFFELVHSYQIPFICLSSYRFKESYGEGWRNDGTSY